MEQLRIGVIGAGRAGLMHINNMMAIPTIHIAAVADANIESIQAHLPIGLTARLYDSAAELLADADVDAVCIFAPTDAHETLCRLAAQAHKHIFCEKPLSMNRDETVSLDLLTLIERAGVKLQIGFNRRFDTQFMKVREHAQQFSENERQIVKITSRDPDLLPHELIKRIGGLIFDFTMHDFDMARYIMGKEVRQVYVQGTQLIDPTLAEINDVDTLAAIVTHVDGAMTIIDNSRKAVYGYDQRLELFGSLGMVKAENVTGSSVQMLTDTMTTEKNPYPNFATRYQAAYRAELVAFANSILLDQPIQVTGIDAIMAQRIAIAAERSLQIGAPVAVDPTVPVIR